MSIKIVHHNFNVYYVADGNELLPIKSFQYNLVHVHMVQCTQGTVHIIIERLTHDRLNQIPERTHFIAVNRVLRIVGTKYYYYLGTLFAELLRSLYSVYIVRKIYIHKNDVITFITTVHECRGSGKLVHDKRKALFLPILFDPFLQLIRNAGFIVNQSYIINQVPLLNQPDDTTVLRLYPRLSITGILLSFHTFFKTRVIKLYVRVTYSTFCVIKQKIINILIIRSPKSAYSKKQLLYAKHVCFRYV